MPGEAIWVIVFVVAVLVGPFATLRAVSHLRGRRKSAQDAQRARDARPSSASNKDEADPD